MLSQVGFILLTFVSLVTICNQQGETKQMKKHGTQSMNVYSKQNVKSAVLLDDGA
jgi:hypothetical protein